MPGIKDIQELFQARKMVEAGLAEMAALNRTELNVEKMNHLLTNPTAEGWESDYLFHLAIAEAAGNTIMIHFIEFISTTLKKSMVDFHQFIQSQPAIVQTINEQHFTIFRAIEEKDANQAHNLMIEHLSFVEELLQKRIFQQY